jgi:hypothetical protein
MVLTLKRFPKHLNFLEMPLTYGIMAMTWYIVSEDGRLLVDGFIMESINSCGYSLSISKEIKNIRHDLLLTEDKVPVVKGGLKMIVMQTPIPKGQWK